MIRPLALGLAALVATPALAQDRPPLVPLVDVPDIEERVVYERCMALFGIFVNTLENEADVAAFEEQQLGFLGASLVIIFENNEASDFDSAFEVFAERSLPYTDDYLALVGSPAGEEVIMSDLSSCEIVAPMAAERAAALE